MDELSILCSGNPYPWPWGYGSAYVLRVGEQRLMFDCGPAATDKLVKMGMMPYDIDNLFFTHHHFDHDVDYPCFLLTRWDSGSGKDNLLHVYGPNLTEQLTERILDKDVGAFAHDWTARINHPLSLGAYTSRGGILPRKPPVVDAKDVGPGKVADSGDWEVVSAPAYHVQPWLDSLAYRVNTSSGSVVFTGGYGAVRVRDYPCKGRGRARSELPRPPGAHRWHARGRVHVRHDQRRQDGGRSRRQEARASTQRPHRAPRQDGARHRRRGQGVRRRDHLRPRAPVG